MPFNTIESIRDAFWSDHSEWKDQRYPRKGHNHYNATIRSEFSRWLDSMHRDNLISDKHAQNATL